MSACGLIKNAGKAAYLFSVNEEEKKVVHLNSVPKGDTSDDWNAKIWMDEIVKIVGGKVACSYFAPSLISIEYLGVLI